MCLVYDAAGRQVTRYKPVISPDSTVTRFGPKVGQIARCAKMYWIWSENFPDLSHLGPIWPTLGPNLVTVRTYGKTKKLLFHGRRKLMMLECQGSTKVRSLVFFIFLFVLCVLLLPLVTQCLNWRIYVKVRIYMSVCIKCEVWIKTTSLLTGE